MAIEVYSSLEPFLYEALNKSFEEQGVLVSDEAEYYVHHLLLEHIRSENLNTVYGFGDSSDPLAIMVSEAFHAPTLHEQFARLVAIGDYAFFIASFAEESIKKRVGNIKYCMGIGSNSYLEAGSMCHMLHRPTKHTDIYRELGLRFPDLVRVASNALVLEGKSSPTLLELRLMN